MKESSGIDELLKKILEYGVTKEDKQLLADLIISAEKEITIKKILNRQLSEYNEVNDVNNNSSQDYKFDTIYRNVLNEIKKREPIQTYDASFLSTIASRKVVIGALSVAALFVFAFFLGGLYVKSGNNIAAEQLVAISYNEIKAPFGSKSQVLLPDSTEVILNAGSKIRYASNYNQDNRDIVLEGEAYFKVAKNNIIPLNVIAGNINVKATGTEFNIKAYIDEQIIETTLIEGKVEITQFGNREDKNQFIDLIPNQKAIYLKESESFKLEKGSDVDSITFEPARTIYENILISPKVDVTQVVAWTKGRLVIRGESLDNLCIELQRKYDVTITFSDEKIKKYRFSGVLLDETLEQVLNVIKLTAPIQYTLKGKSVLLSADPDQLTDYSKHLK